MIYPGRYDINFNQERFLDKLYILSKLSPNISTIQSYFLLFFFFILSIFFFMYLWIRIKERYNSLYIFESEIIRDKTRRFIYLHETIESLKLVMGTSEDNIIIKNIKKEIYEIIKYIYPFNTQVLEHLHYNTSYITAYYTYKKEMEDLKIK